MSKVKVIVTYASYCYVMVVIARPLRLNMLFINLMHHLINPWKFIGLSLWDYEAIVPGVL